MRFNGDGGDQVRWKSKGGSFTAKGFYSQLCVGGDWDFPRKWEVTSSYKIGIPSVVAALDAILTMESLGKRVYACLG